MAITKVSSSLIDANLTITGGTVDDTVIGSGTPAAGTFTTIGGTLASSVTGTTQSAGDNSTKIATTGYVDTATAALVDSAPTTLDTLNELAAALGDDPNFATTVTNSIAAKAPIANPTFTGSFTSPGIDDNADAIAITIDSSENVGIGTSNPGTSLHVNSGANGEILRIQGADAQLRIDNTTSNVMNINSSGSGDSLALSTADTTRVLINSSGIDVTGTAKIEKSGQAINLDTPSSSQNVWLNFSDNGSAKWEIQKNTANLLNIYSYDAGVNVMTFNGSGNVGIGTSSPAGLLNVHSAAGDANLYVTTGNTAASTNIFFGDSGNSSIGRIVYDHNGDYMKFRTNGQDAMRIDSSGNVGIGTSSPLDKLDVAGNLRISDGALVFDKPSVYGFRFLHNDAGNDLSIQQGDANNANYVTRLNIGSTGNTTFSAPLINFGASGGSQHQVFPAFTSTSNLIQNYNGSAYTGEEHRASSFTWRLGTARAMAIDSSGTVMDYITSSGGNADLRYHTGTSVVSYDTSSERFKTNIRDNTTYGLAAVNALQSRMFEYKDDGRTDVGLIAEEVAEVVPELVGLDDENNPLTVDYKRFVSVLVKAMQEQQEQIEDLKAEVAALKGE
jgi:hypothetical protein